MPRETGRYNITKIGDETVKAFVPHPLPPTGPPLTIEGDLAELLAAANAAVARVEVAGYMVPSTHWFLYGFIRKEAVISSQIEGTQATLRDVLAFEATHSTRQPDDVEEICNYVAALNYARTEITRPKGLPMCTRLLCEVHRRLMAGTRGAEKRPGEIRSSQNWIGGNRPGTAKFVPPPPHLVRPAMSDLEKWIHAPSPLPLLVRAGLAHVQFETIHPFLDGNGRVGRLLITLLLEHWGLLSSPLLYLSLAFKRHRAEYYRHLSEVRTAGDWEGWTAFFLECVQESADDVVDTARQLSELLNRQRRQLTNNPVATLPAIRLLDLLPEHPFLTLPLASRLLGVSKPTVIKALKALQDTGILRESTGKRRDRVYAYHDYLHVLTHDTELGGNP